MSSPKISVIVPVYNVEKYLSECLDSIVNQTLKNIEIICLNDGSTDNSLSILQKYASKDKRIKIIDKENEGLGYTRKVGLDIAKGKYVLFCDSDDYYAELTAFEELYNYIEKMKVDVVIFESIRFDKNKGFCIEERDLFNAPQKKIFSYLDMNDILFFRAYAWRKIYSKEFLDSYDDWFFLKHIIYEDIPFHFQITIRSRMSYINKKFYVYRMRENSLGHILNDKAICDRCKIFEEVYKILKEKVNSLDFLNFIYLDFFIAIFGQIFIIKIDTAKKIIDIIKMALKNVDIFLVQQRELFFFLRAGLRMNPENYMDYLNKKKLRNIKKEIQYRDNVIKNLDDAVKHRDNVIKNLDDAVKHRDNVIKNLEDAVKHRDNVIKNLDDAVKYRDNVIKNLDDAVKHRDNVIKNLDNAVKDRDNVIKNFGYE